jgi:hypothetical protein
MSAPGRGTEVQVRFPRVADDSRASGGSAGGKRGIAAR